MSIVILKENLYSQLLELWVYFLKMFRLPFGNSVDPDQLASGVAS